MMVALTESQSNYLSCSKILESGNLANALVSGLPVLGMAQALYGR